MYNREKNEDWNNYGPAECNCEHQLNQAIPIMPSVEIVDSYQSKEQPEDYIHPATFHGPDCDDGWQRLWLVSWGRWINRGIWVRRFKLV